MRSGSHVGKNPAMEATQPCAAIGCEEPAADIAKLSFEQGTAIESPPPIVVEVPLCRVHGELVGQHIVWRGRIKSAAFGVIDFHGLAFEFMDRMKESRGQGEEE
jgi:hypothetical protein